MRVSGGYNLRHCHGLADIAGYVVVRVDTPPAAAAGAGGSEQRTDLAVLEGAGHYQHARDQAAALDAQIGGHAATRARVSVDVVYADGCRMPW
jgi:hypothetical protein